jgi:hypothetical protein
MSDYLRFEELRFVIGQRRQAGSLPAVPILISIAKSSQIAKILPDRQMLK